MMKLTLIHQYFYPEVAGSAIRLTELAAGLCAEGYEVTVLTGLPNHPGGKPVGNKETYRGIRIERIAKTRFNKNRTLGRILNAVLFFAAALSKTWAMEREALLLIGSDPPFLPLLGWFISCLRGQQYVVHVADLYPEMATHAGYIKRHGFIDWLWHRVNRMSFNRAVKIVTLGEQMRKRIVQSASINSAEKVQVIHNWEDGVLIHPIEKCDNWFARKYELHKKTVFLYSGNMGLAHDLITVIEAADFLQGESEIVFLFIGNGGQRNRLVQLSGGRKLRNVLFLPYQPRENLPYSLAAGDAAIVSMKPGTEGLCVPGKFYTALASGQALLALVPRQSEIAELMDCHKVGIRLDPGQPQALAQSVLNLHRNQNLLREFQRNARRCFEHHFTKERAIQEYVSLLRPLT